ncbi:hypothetical protein NDN08_000131 [Rhodosorus marinus]|uniref:Uncharacterized protein n=1 Tax=Rhodosorus marinus TaxID=101924 RepID=A0AAV8UI10_9RHOD|nr:hypothetical protein NDN08_000131 [Rhodosorus marinus]
MDVARNMKAVGVLLVVLTALIRGALSQRLYYVNVRADFGTTLNTGGVETFSRRQFVNGHGTFKPDLDVVPQKLLDYLTTDLQVSFSRSSRGPFKGTSLPPTTSLSKVRTDGRKNLSIKDDYRLRFVSEQRVVTDDPKTIPEITKNEQTESRAITYAGFFFKYFYNNEFVPPKYYECFNEPMGKAQALKKKGESQTEFIERISRLCTRLCREVRKHVPETRTGGPANEFVRPSFNDFEMFKNRIKIWMDTSARGGCQRFVSEHVYNIGGSYAEANLDLIGTYTSWLNDGGKPDKYLVSEMGHSDDIQLSVNALATRQRGFIIMQNLSGKPARVKFNFPHGMDKLKRWTRRRLRISDEKPTNEEKRQNILVGGNLMWKIAGKRAKAGGTLTLPDTIRLDQYETTVFQVTFDKDSRDLRSVKRSRHFAKSVENSRNLKPDFPAPIEKDQKVHYFFDDLPTSSRGVVAIRIAHSRPLGKVDKPKVWINNVLVPSESFSADVAGGYRKFSDGSYYGVFIVYYDLEDFTKGKRAKVSVSYPDNGGWSVSVVLEVDQCSGSSCCVLGHRKNSRACKPNNDNGNRRPMPTPVPT